ncbi:MAG: hypothetical protein LBS21_08780, partial [Clostridiales bacterium]|nr:hypothetical protein [Clostridiales bacterium]
CGGENRFPAAWHNHAVQYNLRRIPAGMFFAGSSGIAKSTVCSLQAAVGLRKVQRVLCRQQGLCVTCALPKITRSLYSYLLPFKTKNGKIE